MSARAKKIAVQILGYVGSTDVEMKRFEVAIDSFVNESIAEERKACLADIAKAKASIERAIKDSPYPVVGVDGARGCMFAANEIHARVAAGRQEAEVPMKDLRTPKNVDARTEEIRRAYVALVTASGKLAVAWDAETLREHPHLADCVRRVPPATSEAELVAAQEAWTSALAALAEEVARPLLEVT